MNIQRLISRVEMLVVAIRAYSSVQELYPARTREESEQNTKVQQELDDLLAQATRIRGECESLPVPPPHTVETAEFSTRAGMSLDAIEERANDLIEAQRRKVEARSFR